MFADLHTHTSLCKHADGTPEEYFENACKRGLSYLGVSDHIPWPAGYDTSSRMNPEQYSEYRSIVRRLRESAENTPVKVLYGIELDWVPGRMDEVSREIQEEPFDYLIGSIHYVGDFAFDNPYEIEKCDSIGVDHVWTRYAGLMCEFVQNFKFDIMGHADLPKKFGHRPSDPSNARGADLCRGTRNRNRDQHLRTAQARQRDVSLARNSESSTGGGHAADVRLRRTFPGRNRFGFRPRRGTRTSSRIPFRTCVRAAPPCGTAFQITFQHGMARQTAGSPLT